MLPRLRARAGATGAEISSTGGGPFDRETALVAWGRELRRIRRGLQRRARPVVRVLSARFASSLTRRIVFLNLGGLLALAVGFLYVNQFREGLIDARVQSLETQGEIIAAAVSASASVSTDAIQIDPEKLLQLSPGQAGGGLDESSPSLQFSINPERIGPVLRRLVLPTRTRARVFDRDGTLLIDSRSLNRHTSVFRSNLPAASSSSASEDGLTLIERTWNVVKGRFGRSEPPRAEEFTGRNGKNFPEVEAALGGMMQNVVRVNARGDTIISVAVPIRSLHAVNGVLLMSTLGGDIDGIIATERWAIVRIFLVSAVIMFLLSLFLAGTIAEPMRRLAEASDRVRRGTKSRQEIPDFTMRSDEIGHLSGSLRDMTAALYARIEAIERFAADVAHELKNPLTSLRSAVETLPIARTQSAQERLMAIIQHDVKRLDRLISDISDASRLDAELARSDNQDVDLMQVMAAVVAVANGVDRDHVKVSFDATPMKGRGRHDAPYSGQRLRFQARSGIQQPHRQRALVLEGRRARPRRPASPQGADSRSHDGGLRDRGRRRRPRHPGRRVRAHLRALLHRPTGSGLRPEFGARPVHLAPDRRGPWRHDRRRQPGRGAAGRR